MIRNDEFKFNSRSYDAIVLSPGPGLPSEAGQLIEIIEYFIGKVPIFGVCLGMQAIGEMFGGVLVNQNIVKHGIQEEIEVNDSTLFKMLPRKIQVGLYHSWLMKFDNEVDLSITSVSESGVIMSFENKEKMIYAVQFHPESVLTPNGMEIVKNFIEVI